MCVNHKVVRQIFAYVPRVIDASAGTLRDLLHGGMATKGLGYANIAQPPTGHALVLSADGTLTFKPEFFADLGEFFYRKL